NHFFDLFRGQEQLAATPASDTEEFSYQSCVPDMDNWFGKFNMTKMSWAFARLLVTCLASEPGVNHTQVEIHQSLRVGEPIVIIGICPDDLPNTHGAYLFWREQAKFYLSYTFWTWHNDLFLLHHIFKLHPGSYAHTLHFV